MHRYYESRHLPGVVVDRSRFDGALYRGHMSSDFVLWALLDGANEQWHERGVRTVHPDTVQLINPGEFMRPIKRWTSTTEDLAISIAPSVLAAAFDAASPLASRAPAFETFQVRDEALRCASRAFAGTLLAQAATPLETETAFADLVNALVAHNGLLRPVAGLAPPKLLAVRDYLHEHYTEAIRLEHLEELTGLTRYYIVRQFRVSFGLPPHAYQTQLRIMHACRLLRGGFPLAHVGVEVGFSDQSHFYRHFKRLVRVTPLSYQKSFTRGAWR